jgi:hypothetical protein
MHESDRRDGVEGLAGLKARVIPLTAPLWAALPLALLPLALPVIPTLLRGGLTHFSRGG